jgi:hypothetical protein
MAAIGLGDLLEDISEKRDTSHYQLSFQVSQSKHQFPT